MTPADLRRVAKRYEDRAERYADKPAVADAYRELARECRVRAAFREHGLPDSETSIFKEATR